MQTSFPMLPAEIEAAVVAQHGGPVTVPGKQGDHVVMSVQTYREMMGFANDEEFAESVEALRKSLAQADAGNTISLEEARQRLIDKYGV